MIKIVFVYNLKGQDSCRTKLCACVLSINPSDYKNQKIYDARRLIQQARDADHARMCDLLAQDRHLASLEKQLALNLDLSKSCVTFDGDRDDPVMLLCARYGTSLAPMQAMLERGADPKAMDENGNTLLHCLAMNLKPGGNERLAFALAAGGDPAAVNHKGQTALDRARLTRNQFMIEALAALNH